MTMRSRVLLVLVLTGCSRSGTEIQWLRETVQSSGQKSAMGFSVDDVLAGRGHVNYPLAWRAAPPSADYNPSSGSTALSIDIAYQGANIDQWTLASEPPHDPNGGPLPLAHLETDVDLTITTGDGALNEHSTGHLSATSARDAEVTATLDASKLTGTFRVARIDHKGAYYLWLGQIFESAGDGRGSMDVSASTTDPTGPNGSTSGSGATVQVAEWPRQ
jgi:hypothetical protein